MLRDLIARLLQMIVRRESVLATVISGKDEIDYRFIGDCGYELILFLRSIGMMIHKSERLGGSRRAIK